MCACLCVCPKSGDVLPWSPSPLISVVRTVAITLAGFTKSLSWPLSFLYSPNSY